MVLPATTGCAGSLVPSSQVIARPGHLGSCPVHGCPVPSVHVGLRGQSLAGGLKCLVVLIWTTLVFLVMQATLVKRARWLTVRSTNTAPVTTPVSKLSSMTCVRFSTCTQHGRG